MPAAKIGGRHHGPCEQEQNGTWQQRTERSEVRVSAEPVDPKDPLFGTKLGAREPVLIATMVRSRYGRPAQE
jgi:hypothetical protein